MEEALASLQLADEEEEALQEIETTANHTFHLSLVGRCLTESVVHFPSLRNTLADLWHPIMGICISDLGDKRYLFKFFHEVDIQRVIGGAPWFFNNHLLLLHRLQDGENPMSVLLNSSAFWVQVHDLPPGLMSENMAKQMGGFIGQYIEYDTFFSSLGNKNFMRIRVLIDVSFPLKRKKKVLLGPNGTVYARFSDSILASLSQGANLGGKEDLTGNKEGNFGGADFIPNQSHLKLIQMRTLKERNIWHSKGPGDPYGAEDVIRPIVVDMGDENDPIQLSEGKKRQRIVVNSDTFLHPNSDRNNGEIAASSARQSSRLQ
ncbi:nucleolin-like [Gossypium australe]|uniref:Nucleolin-like n=1 Tax=Gossypium australe TaxID=47621 RepID=A0A5B6UPJ2_9ROSI|nr:nucleolin-like [Gossypium australe]